jgi:hypothetical protein
MQMSVVNGTASWQQWHMEHTCGHQVHQDVCAAPSVSVSGRGAYMSFDIQPCGSFEILLKLSDVGMQIDKTYLSISFCFINMFSCAVSFFLQVSLWWRAHQFQVYS